MTFIDVSRQILKRMSLVWIKGLSHLESIYVKMKVHVPVSWRLALNPKRCSGKKIETEAMKTKVKFMTLVRGIKRFSSLYMK